jgi:hypothetical protein
MRVLLPFLGFLALADAAASVPAQMRLKGGTVYELKEPPRLKDGRFVFTTQKGKCYSLAEDEVSEIQLLSRPDASTEAPNPQDSRQLGAIARQQRREKGRYTAIAPAPTPRPRRGAP